MFRDDKLCKSRGAQILIRLNTFLYGVIRQCPKIILVLAMRGKPLGADGDAMSFITDRAIQLPPNF